MTDQPKYRIGIATSGRFHVLDLAREFDALGHDVTFYTIVPPWRCEKFGLRRKTVVFLWPLAPLAYLAQILPQRFRNELNAINTRLIDWLVARLLRPCDVFICMSGLFVAAPRKAKSRFGALIFLERGSRHILSQAQILKGLPASEQVSPETIQREMAGYASADIIAVPAKHVVDSFVAEGIDAKKLFPNPYGVDVSMFRPTPMPPTVRHVLIFVGAWSYQKGVDILVEAVRRNPGVELMHVGRIADAPFPAGEQFHHTPHVDQRELINYYARAHTFVLASRQEGLALVQIQALATGLDLICTERTGGADLAAFLDRPDRIAVVPADDPGALARLIAQRSEAVKNEIAGRERQGLGDAELHLTWAAYGRRYALKISAQMADRVRS